MICLQGLMLETIACWTLREIWWWSAAHPQTAPLIWYAWCFHSECFYTLNVMYVCSCIKYSINHLFYPHTFKCHFYTQRVGFLPARDSLEEVFWVTLEDSPTLSDIDWQILTFTPPPEQDNIQYRKNKNDFFSSIFFTTYSLFNHWKSLFSSHCYFLVYFVLQSKRLHLEWIGFNF